MMVYKIDFLLGRPPDRCELLVSGMIRWWLLRAAVAKEVGALGSLKKCNHWVPRSGAVNRVLPSHLKASTRLVESEKQHKMKIFLFEYGLRQLYGPFTHCGYLMLASCWSIIFFWGGFSGTRTVDGGLLAFKCDPNLQSIISHHFPVIPGTSWYIPIRSDDCKKCSNFLMANIYNLNQFNKNQTTKTLSYSPTNFCP